MFFACAGTKPCDFKLAGECRKTQRACWPEGSLWAGGDRRIPEIVFERNDPVLLFG